MRKSSLLTALIISTIALITLLGTNYTVLAQSGENTAITTITTTNSATDSNASSAEQNATTSTTTATTTDISTNEVDPNKPDSEGKINGKYVLYVQEGCSHCAKVESFIIRNNISDKVEVRDIKESGDNYAAFNELVTKYKTDSATPLMEAKGSALLGDEPIISFLSKEFNATNMQDPADVVVTIGFVLMIAIFLYGIITSLRAKN